MISSKLSEKRPADRGCFSISGAEALTSSNLIPVDTGTDENISGSSTTMSTIVGGRQQQCVAAAAAAVCAKQKT